MCFRAVAFLFVVCGSPFAAFGNNLRKAPTDLVKNAGELLLDADFQASQLEMLKQETLALVPRLNAGGRTARCARAFYVFPDNVRAPVPGVLSRA